MLEIFRLGERENVGDVAGLAIADLDADGIGHDQPRQPRRRFHRDLGGNPGAERYADHGEVAKIELVEEIEIKIRQIVDRAHALGQFRAAEARMRRRDDVRRSWPAASIAAAAGSMPFSAWRKSSGRPAPRSIKSIRVPSTTSESGTRSSCRSASILLFSRSCGAFQARSVVLPRQTHFAIARGVRAETRNDGRRVTIQNGIAYANHDGVELAGRSLSAESREIAEAGAGFGRRAWRRLGRRRAQRLSILGAVSRRARYRGLRHLLSARDQDQDVPAKRCRTCSPACNSSAARRSAFGIDPARIGLIGASAGAHLAALAALRGKKFAGGYPQDAVRRGRHRRQGA